MHMNACRLQLWTWKSRNFIGFKNNRKEQWRIIVFHLSCRDLFVGSGFVHGHFRKYFLGIFHFYYDTQQKALLPFYIAASVYEYIDYNHAFGNLLTLYTVGTLANSTAKENWFITL